ncbi:MAG: hypothetical protein IAX22_00410 [Candidatus Bathyarchaeota archaeon]|nr:hypothetical protein [Candidatus Bathyarchaeota archaeon]
MGIISKTLALLLVGLFLISVATIQPITVKAQSKTIVVPNDYITIQSAIDHANNGDTVFVKKGYYPETLVVNKSISVIGEDRNLTIIDGQKKLSQVVLLNVDNITFSNFTLGNSGFEPPRNSGWYDSNGMGEGIKIYPSGFPTPQFINIINNTIVDCPYFGIEAGGNSWYHTIVGNTIIGRYAGDPPLPYPTWGLGSGISINCVDSLFAYNTFINTTVSFSFYTEGYKDRNTFIENKEINTTITYSPFPSITPTASPSPSPTINNGPHTEPFPMYLLTVASGIIALIIISVLLYRRHQKTAISNKQL